jgi:transcriptional regulator with XRE-family HTH domain
MYIGSQEKSFYNDFIMKNLNSKMEIIGQNIRTARENKKFSRNEFSNIAKISSTHLYRIEKGQSTYQAPLLIKLAKLLDVTVQDFYEGV